MEHDKRTPASIQLLIDDFRTAANDCRVAINSHEEKIRQIRIQISKLRRERDHLLTQSEEGNGHV